MALIEVDENAFHNNQKLVGIVQKMLAHPVARRKVLEAHKDIDPTVSIPEIDARKPVEDAVMAVNKRLEDFMAAQTKERDEEKKKAERDAFVSKFEGGRQSLLNNHGVTEEGLKAVEDLMAKAGIVDHEIGWAAFSKLNPEPEPAPPAPNFGFGGIFQNSEDNPDKFIKAMHASRGQDQAALDRRVHEILTEVRQQNAPNQQRRGFGR